LENELASAFAAFLSLLASATIIFLVSGRSRGLAVATGVVRGNTVLGQDWEFWAALVWCMLDRATFCRTGLESKKLLNAAWLV
jgi:hypothetical protein